METKIKFDDYYIIAAGILNGEFDEYLDGMMQTIKSRMDALAPKATDYNVGDRVRYTSNTRPKYLAGEQGTIVQINRTKVVVQLDRPCGRFRGRITTPVNLIEGI